MSCSHCRVLLFVVRRGDVLAAWSGIRPLVTDPSSKHTKSISRNHVIEIGNTKLVTIAGGKWTTYRAMAADAVDAAVKSCSKLPPCKESQTEDLILEGGEGWSPTFFIRLVQEFGFEPEVDVLLSLLLLLLLLYMCDQEIKRALPVITMIGS